VLATLRYGSKSEEHPRESNPLLAVLPGQAELLRLFVLIRSTSHQPPT